MVAPSVDGPTRDEAPRSVVDRALLILGTFRGGCERQSLSGISRRSGLPVATAYRLVQKLTAWGALERDEDGRYRIGLKLWEIGSLAPRSTDLRHVARPFMHDLHDITHSNVQLAIREGHSMVSVEHFSRPTGEPRPWIVGRRYGLRSTAIGLVLLAHAPRPIQEEILAAPLKRFTPYTCVDPEELDRVLTRIRHRGYVVSDRQVRTDLLGVAAPVRAPDGSVVAALSLVCEYEVAAVKSMVRAVLVSASGISRALREMRRSGDEAADGGWDRRRQGA